MIEANIAPEFEVHLMFDGYRASKMPLVHRPLPDRPRFHLHCTPTGGS